MKKIILVSLLTLGLGTSALADTVCKVTKSVPNYKTIRVRTPQTTSYQERVTSSVQCGYTYQEQRSNDNGLETIIGLGIGGLIGHQFGKGSGKALATGVGALIGASSVNDGRNSSSYNRVPKYCNETHYETRYRTTYTYSNVNEVTNYTNYFNYKGVEYIKTSYTPLTTVTVKTAISY